MKSETTVTASRSFDSDRMFLNGEEEDVAASKRMSAVIRCGEGAINQTTRHASWEWTLDMHLFV